MICYLAGRNKADTKEKTKKEQKERKNKYWKNKEKKGKNFFKRKQYFAVSH